MYILGLNIGHNATACLLKDGKIIACVSEERFTRIKNYSGIPFKSINFLLENNKINMQDIDLIVLDSYYDIETDPYFGKRFLEDYTKKSLKNKIFSKLGYSLPRLFEKYYKIKAQRSSKNKYKIISALKQELAKILKVPESKIEIINHHLIHAFAPCFNLPRNKKTLIFSLDGEGDGICATVNIFDGKNMKRISKTKKTASLGYLYAITTIYLGMKPLEHEFKVMGMAPYAKKDKVEKIYDKFRKLFLINNNLEFESKFNMPFADNFFSKELKFVRFDTICGAVQRLTEELIYKWIKIAIEKTGINSIALTGGVMMNVKACQKVSELPEVKDIFIMPSTGDESNAIGACFYGYKLFCEKNNTTFNPIPFQDLYLGPDYSDEEIEQFLKQEGHDKKYKITKPKNIEKETAKLLAKGEVVARFNGKSEWGARALGNRSILANPSNRDIIRVLNEFIKHRDFWMPFTPSMLDEDEKKYIINKKKIKAPYMVITFESTDKAKKDIIAAMHPYDFTVRPQIVYKNWNPSYYKLIKEFKKLTSVGAVLNTSFNLHGEPNVLSPKDALHTVEESGLKYLAIGDFLLEKKTN